MVTKAFGTKKIVACVVVDVEEEFDWTQPFSTKNANVSAVTQLPAVQKLFEK